MISSNALRASFKLMRSFTQVPTACFSEKGWKERDEAAEKVFISRQESTPCVKLRIGDEEATGEAQQRQGVVFG